MKMEFMKDKNIRKIKIIIFFLIINFVTVGLVLSILLSNKFSNKNNINEIIKVNNSSEKNSLTKLNSENINNSQPQHSLDEVFNETNNQNDTNYMKYEDDSDLEKLNKVYTEVMIYGNEEYLYNFTLEELAIIRNTLFASKGYIFSKEKYKKYFSSKDWYSGYTKDPYLTKDEKHFVEIIKKYEKN